MASPIETRPQQGQIVQRSLLVSMAEARSLSPDNFQKAIRATVFPRDGSNEQLMAFLLVADKYQLDPFLREIYAFPSKGGGVMPIVGIDGWSTLVNRQASYDGVEFVEKFASDGKLTAITASIYRKDRSHPTVVTEYLEECKRPTEPWQRWPIRMLRHKAFIQAARIAFSLSGIVDDDEAARIDPSLAPILDAQQTTANFPEANESLMEQLGWTAEQRRQSRNAYRGREEEHLEYVRQQVEAQTRRTRTLPAAPQAEAPAPRTRRPRAVEPEPVQEAQPEQPTEALEEIAAIFEPDNSMPVEQGPQFDF